LRVPSTVVCPRDGSLALACFGRVRKVQPPETAWLGYREAAVAAGRKSIALKRIIFEAELTLE
jgi:hypothetical protein